MDFEKLNLEIEQIITKLENENTTLTEGLSLYARANELIDLAEKQLNEAKAKIEILKGENDENI